MNKDYLNEDTIAAISTAHGIGGIAVVRISGKSSQDILNKIFKRLNNRRVYDMKTHKLYRGQIYDGEGFIVDDVLCVYMKSPNSYTGEDTVEIHSHGGTLIPKMILELCIANGARVAGPGEFTYRAYLNGKLDLLQAEAVADIIESQTELALRNSQSQLEGNLSAKINWVKETILDILAEIEANVDFPEEEIDPLIKSSIILTSNELIDYLQNLLSTYNSGVLIKNGLATAIIGKPNVGKSSLLNKLLQRERSIVSHIPGTTRDFIEESINIKGIPLKLIDTAGIRNSLDKVEKTGVEITKRKIELADLILVVLDSSNELTAEDSSILEYTYNNKSIVVLNKCDLQPKVTTDMISREYNCSVVETSAKHEINIEKLKDKIYRTVTDNCRTTDTDGTVISDIRHKSCLEKALGSMNQFIMLLEQNESPEYLSIDLRCALDSIGEIVGETSTEELLGKIFSKFCIGK